LRAILTSDAAKGRPEQARSFAFDTDLDAEHAIALLSKAPVEAPATTSSGLLVEMAAMARPDNGVSPPLGGNGPVFGKFAEGEAAAKFLLGK
jgi:hypothetical protein